jgi:3-dehydroquinate dehydratase type I
MKLFVTIYEETPAAALQAIRAIDLDHDGIELRAEKFGELDLAAFRAATDKTLMLTHRGQRPSPTMIERGLEAGFDLIDIEYGTDLDRDVLARFRDRMVVSHHDYERVPDLEPLLREMISFGCAHTKLAATPADFADNQRLLAAIKPGVSVIGMGERGLYSRILAPFRGSELSFVSTSDARSAAPAQITLRRALAIYGNRRDSLRADRVFGILGNPSGHSLSPTIHNRLFREKRVSAAYTIASFESFAEVEDAFLAGEPCGLSVTAPFKQDAFAFAVRVGASIGENARACGAVNTLVHTKEIVADNTDVDGFETILREVCGLDRKSVALVGGGGTSRSAMVALTRAGMHVTRFNRSGQAEPLDRLAAFDGEVIVNTLPGHVDITVPSRAGMTWIESAYGSDELAERHAKLRAGGVQVYDGLDLLHAQAVRQHELFMRVFE